MFVFEEKFLCFDENYKPYGIEIESSSNLWHKHAHPTEKGYTVYCTGNKYLLNTPESENFELELTYKFETLNNYAGISVFFGYNRNLHSGYELRAEWMLDSETTCFTVFAIREGLHSEIEKIVLQNIPFPFADVTYTVKVGMNEGKLSAHLSTGEEVSFLLKKEEKQPEPFGLLGFSRPDFVGNVHFFSAVAKLPDAEEKEINNLTVQIPTVNGGTMPLRVSYRHFTVNEKSYMTATLDGGPQYRDIENYCPYPCNRIGQYVVEMWFINQPYVKINGKIYRFSMDNVNLTDPHLAWKKILYDLLNLRDLPISITFPIMCEKTETYAFGYERLFVGGYRLQGGKNEFNYASDGRYLGETVFSDTFRLCSPEDKRATQIIPKTVFDYKTVVEHFAKNHYFTPDEEIRFKVFSHSDKKYLSYKAELRNVFGEFMENVPVIKGEITHSPLPVGVYRIHLTVIYGDSPFKEFDTVFEVFDETGKLCAPLQSGLPVLFSMPNEQQYLDRDPFDPWNNGAANNIEHYYSCTAFTGHVAEYKRTWEVTKLFGRSWYVWLSTLRTMVDCDYRDHMDIVKNADYIYYPSDYEWGVLRSECFSEGLWSSMPKTIELFNEFLDSHEGARDKIGYTRGEKANRDHVTKLHTLYKREWYSLLAEKTTEAFAAQNELFKKINPEFKRSCYGPFPVYASTMRTTELTGSSGLANDGRLSDVVYTGFAQFEDYPYSCAYQTYRGAFGVGASLVKSPNLAIYPEQYRSSIGGCIDGAVYFAHPPIGAYIMPDYFNTSLSREYVYNTPHKTEDSFAYWHTYGFMKPDMTDEEIYPFIRDWKYVLKYQPKRPMRSAVYVCEFDGSDDVFELDYPGYRAPCNISEEGVGYLYEASRLAGLPAGFFASWDALLTVSSKDTDLVVLPSTVSASCEVIEHIRKLYSEGVSLIAVSRVDGLEDLFGVTYSPEEVHYYGIEANGKRESVFPYTSIANYKAADAEVILSADITPVIFKKDRTALLNISPSAIDRSSFFEAVDLARSSVSELLRDVSISLMRDLSAASVFAEDEKCGITLFEDTNGNNLLLAIDYSEHDQKKLYEIREKKITFKNGGWSNAEAIDGKPMRRLIDENGNLDGIVISLRPHESALIRLY